MPRPSVISRSVSYRRPCWRRWRWRRPISATGRSRCSGAWPRRVCSGNGSRWSPGPNYRLLLSVLRSAIAVADLVAWHGRPVAAILVVGLGVLAGAIFAPRERRVWMIAGVGYAGVMLLAPMLLRADEGSVSWRCCCCLRSCGRPMFSAISPAAPSAAQSCVRRSARRRHGRARLPARSAR